MDLSVIIVNYNVKYFLEHCLYSVYKSIEGLHGEVIVVDNNSVDGSCQMVKEKFPEVVLIENKENFGFSKANNQGIRICNGKYVLILNPDTVVQENTFRKCFDFMESHPNAGALGVKMINGSGNFLPESKRSLPTPSVSFYKIFGLSALFPKSRIFGRYHLGYLDNNATSKIEILTGAFMFIRKITLDKIGMFDETFFMYGEDIDLSYRIIKAGYENYYFPETTIIHYKGESTRKGSINYVMIFYRAMVIFAKKHFSPGYARLYSLLINLAVYLRASISILRRVFLSTLIPLADVLLIFFGFYFLKPFWEIYKFGIKGYYPNEFLIFAVPSYIFIWLLFIYLFGGYEKRTKPLDLIRGLTSGTITLLLIYALLPESYRYSRALIIIGTLWVLLIIFITRLTLGSVFKNVRLMIGKQKKRIVIAGSHEESKRIMAILMQADIQTILLGLVKVNNRSEPGEFIGDFSQLDEIVKINKIDEIIFCSKDISSEKIIQMMLSLGNITVEFKIAPQESLSIIGSNSINTSGELYLLHFNSLSRSISRRRKRILDLALVLIFLASFPVMIFIVKKPLGFLSNIFLVLIGSRTWVGFYTKGKKNIVPVPDLPEGILSPISFYDKRVLIDEVIDRMNLLYAKDYRILNDFYIILKDIRFLGH